MPAKYSNSILIFVFVLLFISAKAGTVFIEMRSVPRTLLFDATNHKRWKRAFADFEAGTTLKNHFFTGINFSYNRNGFDYPVFYYHQNHKQSDFWQQSYSSGIFVKKEISTFKLFEKGTHSLLIGAYLFFSIYETHKLIILDHHYGRYEIPININQQKFGCSFQLANWFRIGKHFIFEPAIQLGYYKLNSIDYSGEYYISGHGYISNKNNLSLNMTFSLIYFIKARQ